MCKIAQRRNFFFEIIFLISQNGNLNFIERVWEDRNVNPQQKKDVLKCCYLGHKFAELFERDVPITLFCKNAIRAIKRGL